MLADLFALFSVLITLAAVAAYVNARTLRLPSGVVLMLMGTLLSISLILVGKVSPAFTALIRTELGRIDFSEFILGVLLSFLIFAGSLHVRMDDLSASAGSITVFALAGTLISTFAVGLGVYALSPWFGIEIPLTYCLLFGALISPTDPVAVIGILSKSHLPKRIQTNIVGESLFNDGVGVVIFAILLHANAMGTDQVTVASVAGMFVREAFGGLLMGAAIGFVGYQLMKRIDHFQTEILISLAMVMGGYSLCHYIHVSGPLAMVIAGVITGNKGKAKAMSDQTRDYLEKFWEVLDDILNGILFMLIGLEIVVVDFQLQYVVLGLAVTLLVVLARFASLWLPVQIFFMRRSFDKAQLKIMTWGGLRGGISVALALSLPPSTFKNVLVTVTFIVVFFSIFVQGLTVGSLIKRLSGQVPKE
jgi:monovalent cation:H+ antiporter, CPA1 family